MATRTGYLGLGSNIGDRRAHLESAAAELGDHGVEVVTSSSVYETEPVGLVLDQPDFLNACLRVETELDPEPLLDVCKAVEREVGQRLLIDLRIDVGDCDATITDRIEDTVDYGQVCEVANLVAQQRNYKTLERLCTAIADRILNQWDVSAIWVKAAKPEPPLALPVTEVSVEVWREAGPDADD